MKFSALRKFGGRNLDEVLKYVAGDINRVFKDWSIGLTKLAFDDNFESFTYSFTVASGATTAIPNTLGRTDLEWMIVRASGGVGLVEDQATSPWTRSILYLKNSGAASITATVRFFRG